AQDDPRRRLPADLHRLARHRDARQRREVAPAARREDGARRSDGPRPPDARERGDRPGDRHRRHSGRSPEDDTVRVPVLRPGTMHEEIRFSIRNDLRELARAGALANALLERGGIAAQEAYPTHLALEEILSNVIRHGYEDAGEHEISVRLRVDDGRVELQVEDDGREFDPLSAPEVDLGVPLEERRV